MTICSFLAHEALYDTRSYLVDKARKTIRQIAETEAEIEFWFYCIAGFQGICLEAVLEAKRQYPEIRIQIVFVILKREMEQASTHNSELDLIVKNIQVPSCIVNRIVTAPVEPDATCFVVANKKMVRWIIKQSNYIISYVYPSLLESINQQYALVKRKNNEFVFNVTHEGTELYIQQCVVKLPEREHFIVEKHTEGKTYKEIGVFFGVSPEHIRYLRHEAENHLKIMTKQRLTAMLGDGESTRERACGIVGLNTCDANEETLKTFEEVIVFLICHCGVRTFILEQLYCATPFAMTLISKQFTYFNVSVRILTHYPETADMNQIRHDYIPPFDEIQNIPQSVKRVYAKQLRVHKALIDQCDFLIIKSGSSSRLLQDLSNYMQKKREIKIFDISYVCQSDDA